MVNLVCLFQKQSSIVHLCNKIVLIMLNTSATAMVPNHQSAQIRKKIDRICGNTELRNADVGIGYEIHKLTIQIAN